MSRLWPSLLMLLGVQAALGQRTFPLIRASMSAEYRIAPIYFEGIDGVFSGPHGLHYNPDRQIIGWALGPDLRLNLYRRWVELGYSLRIRYGHLLYADPLSSPITPAMKVWTANHLLLVAGKIPVGQEKHITLHVGVGFMNRGSDYAITETDTLPNGQAIYFISTGDFNFSATAFGLGYNIRGVELGIAAYHAAETNFFIPGAILILAPYLKYDLRLPRREEPAD